LSWYVYTKRQQKATEQNTHNQKKNTYEQNAEQCITKTERKGVRVKIGSTDLERFREREI